MLPACPAPQPALQLLAAEERPVQHDVGHRAERVGPHGRGQHGKLAAALLRGRRRPDRLLHGLEGFGDLLGLADVRGGVRGAPAHASTAATPARRCSSERETTRWRRRPEPAPPRWRDRGPSPPVTMAVVPAKVSAGRKGDPLAAVPAVPWRWPPLLAFEFACCFLALAA